MRVTWLPPLPEAQNGVIIGYVISITDLESSNDSYHIEVNPEARKTSITDLKLLHPYNISIAAETVVGVGPFSFPQTILTVDIGRLIEAVRIFCVVVC